MAPNPLPSTAPSAGPVRVALYGHDTYGLGHLRRNTRLAHAILEILPEAEILLLTGSPRAHVFPVAPQVQIVKLPSVTKDEQGRYVSLQTRIPLEQTVRLRRDRIRQAILAFEPHLLIADHAPLGLCGELLPLLADLRQRGGTRLVAGLRDILDAPEVVQPAFARTHTEDVLQHLYHEVWVYGDEQVFPVHDEYRFSPALAQKVRYLGYLAAHREDAGLEDGADAASLSASFRDTARPHVLCTAGGGGDGATLSRAFLGVAAAPDCPFNATLVTGPFLPRDVAQQLDARYSGLSNLQILRFTSQLEDLIRGSDLVVGMGGYNSVVECLQLRRPLLVVPRRFPRQEQLLRARQMAGLGLLRWCEPRDLTPSLLGRTLRDALQDPRPPSPEERGIRWRGLDGVRERVSALLHPPAMAQRRAS